MPRILLSLCCLLLFSTPVLCQTSPAPPKSREQVRTCTALPARQQILLTGFTRARATLDITAEVSGRSLEITADTGETIAEDGIFAVIDSTLIRLELQANEVSNQQVKRRLRFDSQQVERYQRLLTSKSSSKARLDELELQLDQSRLKLDQLQVEQERLQELLSRHQVQAPPGWQIIERHVEPGQWVAAGSVLARAGDYRTLLVPLALTPAELHSIRQEQTIPLYLPGEGVDGQAILHRVSPGFDPVTRKIRVELLLDQSTYEKMALKQGGIRVEIPIRIPDPMHAFLVPAHAVVERYEEHWLTRQDTSQVRVIILGPATGPDENKEWLRITSPDLKAGDVFTLPPAAQDRQ